VFFCFLGGKFFDKETRREKESDEGGSEGEEFLFSLLLFSSIHVGFFVVLPCFCFFWACTLNYTTDARSKPSLLFTITRSSVSGIGF